MKKINLFIILTTLILSVTAHAMMTYETCIDMALERKDECLDTAYTTEEKKACYTTYYYDVKACSFYKIEQ